MATDTPSAQSTWRSHPRTDEEAGGRLAPKTVYHPSLAQRAVRRHSPEVGAVCGKVARTDLCGGREVTRVPTATVANGESIVSIRHSLLATRHSPLTVTCSLRPAVPIRFGQHVDPEPRPAHEYPPPARLQRRHRVACGRPALRVAKSLRARWPGQLLSGERARLLGGEQLPADAA